MHAAEPTAFYKRIKVKWRGCTPPSIRLSVGVPRNGVRGGVVFNTRATHVLWIVVKMNFRGGEGWRKNMGEGEFYRAAITFESRMLRG